MNPKDNARADNAFVKQIFDKKTGKSLVCHLHQGEETWLTFGLSWWDEQTIRYEQVMEEVVAALRGEKQSANHVLELLETEECSREKAIRMQPLTDEARKLFDAMSEIENPDLQLYQLMEHGDLTEEEYQVQKSAIIDRLAEKDRGFTEVVDRVNDLNRAFSKRNPWVKLYSAIDVPDTLVKSQIKVWVDRILVEDMSTVEVLLPESYLWWKNQLPAKWLEVEQ